ncbi:MAG: protein kinase [Labilithrix sp.]|nr:protein kinase [Labilithrix sp.]MCW5814885.1 protein kinase [Labilithrix sp.]
MRVFPDEAGFCPADGSALQFASLVPIPAGDDPRLGTRLCGRYELRRVVADGGMGRVYEGIDKQTQTRVAVKVLHNDVARDEIALERFKREYEISSQLPHDHIVKVLDFQRDEASGVWLLVMEFLDGEELRFILKREKLIPPERIVRMLAQVAVGLDEAHARNVVHRDLKPDNLFLCGTREGDDVKILDFGSVRDNNKEAKKLTVLGTTIGSPYYMAPEQAQGLENLDARADVFALAAISYECMTGTVPFTGNNGPSILLAILTKDPDPPSKKAQAAKFPVPHTMDEVMELALAKNPNHRQPSVGALATAVGHAYGLTGDHKAWAQLPQAELAKQIAEGLARLPPSPNVAPVAIEAAADPFAMRPMAATIAMHGAPSLPASHVPAPVSQQAPSQQYPMSQPMHPQAQPRPAGGDDMRVAGLGDRSPWLIPVVVGIVALLLGGGLVIAFVR